MYMYFFYSFLLLTFCWFYMWSFHMSYVNQDSAPKFMGAECSNQILGVNSSFTFHVFLVKTWQPVTIIGNLLYLDSMNISPCSFFLSKLNCCINFLLLIELFINCFEPFSKEQNTDSLQTILQTTDQFFAFKVPMRDGELNSLRRGLDKAFQVYTQLVTAALGLNNHVLFSR